MYNDEERFMQRYRDGFMASENDAQIPVFARVGRGLKGDKGDKGDSYVPIFAGEWNRYTEYEPLSIVSYNGNSYTSKQAVPSNIDITNEDYWFQSGNYNTQIEAYRQEVLAFDDRITANSDAIADFNLELGSFEETTNIAISDIRTQTDISANMVIAKDGYKKENTILSGHVGGLTLLNNYLYAVTNAENNSVHHIVKMDLNGNIISDTNITDIFSSDYHVNQISTLDGLIAIQTASTLIKFIDENYQVVKTMPTYTASRAYDFFKDGANNKYAIFMSDNPINPYEIFFNDPTTDIYVRTDITIENNMLYFGTLEQAMHVDWPLLVNIQSYTGATFCDTINIRCGGRKSGSIYFEDINEEIEGITTDSLYLYLCSGNGTIYRYLKEDLFKNMMYDWYKDNAMTPYNIVGVGLKHSKTSIDYMIPFEQSGNMKVITPLIWAQAVEKVSTVLIYGIGGTSRPNLLGRAEFGGATPSAHAGFLNQGAHLPVIPIYVLADSHIANAPVTITVKEEGGNTSFTDTTDFLNYINEQWSTNYSKLGIFLTMDENFKFSCIGFE